jgi:tripartite-type tricarboxylate transporter receptor subunit TctC
LPAVRRRLDHDSVETRIMSPQEFTTFVAGEIDKWAPIAKLVMGK